SITLGSDNQAAIKAFKSNFRSPGHHIVREALQLAYRIQNKYKKKKKKSKYALTLRWMAGHEGIEGNETVDREAKKAAEGFTSDKSLLPPYLKKLLLTNPSAIKRAHNDTLQTEWIDTWRRSERGRKMFKINNTTPSKKFLAAISTPEIT